MKGEYMSERHVGKVIQVMGPVLDIRFQEGQLPELLNAIEIENQGSRVIAEVAQQIAGIQQIGFAVTIQIHRDWSTQTIELAAEAGIGL